MIDIVRLALPFTVWLGTFSAIYGLHGIVCAASGSNSMAGYSALLLAWVVSLALQVGIMLALRSRRFASHSAFVGKVSVALAIAAVIANIWAFLPIAVTTGCQVPAL